MNKRIIGTCSLCGGPVEQYTVLHIVGPFPPAQCRNCGATEKPRHGQVIETERSGHPKALWQEGKARD